MSFESRVALIALVLVLFGPVDRAQTVLSETEAREEVETVVERVERYHPDPFRHTPKKIFYAQVTHLLDRRGPVTVAEQYFGLARLLSLVSDTHTQLHITADTPGFDSTYPLRFKLFEDGLYVIAAGPAYRDAIGKKVVAIGGKPAEQVVEQLAHYSFSDSWPRKRVFAEVHLYFPETYAVLGLRNAAGSVPLELEDPAGARFTSELKQTWDKGPHEFGWASLNPFIPEGLSTVHDVLQTERPFYLKRLQDNLWFAFLDDAQRSMYLQVNKQTDSENAPESLDVILDWVRILRQSKVERLIIDVRNDPGGNIFIGNAISGILPELYVSHPTLETIVVLFGTDTVSAGTILVAQLEGTVEPILIGDPSGSAPNMFLHAEKTILPHSKIEVEVSREEYVTTRELDTRRYVVPDVPISPSFDDFAHGRDPALEFAMTTDPRMAREIYGAGGLDNWRRASQLPAMTGSGCGAAAR